MKTLAILVLTLGIVGVIANPVSKQTIQSENKNSPQAESSDSQTKHEEVINTFNKGDQEQKKDTPIENPESPIRIDTSKDAHADGNVEIIIEENTIPPFDDNPPNPGDRCEHGNTEISNIDSGKDEKVEIIIEESHVSPINVNLQLQGDAGGPSLTGYISDLPLLPEFNEDVPQLPGIIEDIPPGPKLPAFMGEGPMPDFIDGPQVTGEFGGGPQLSGTFEDGPQFPRFVEERPQLPSLIGGIPHLPGFIKGAPHMPGSNANDDDDFHLDKDYFREDMDKIEHEIMETAAGFVPTPLVFRRKHKNKPRRRFATRRHFRKNPYRRHQFFYPYSYYAYYRPSSLRFY